MGAARPPHVRKLRQPKSTWAVLLLATLVLLLAAPSIPTASGAPTSTIPTAAGSSAPPSYLGGADRSVASGVCAPDLPPTCATAALAPHPTASSPPQWTDLQSKVTNQVPSHRYLGSMAYDPTDGYLLLFGGYGNGSSAPYSDTWSYANGHWTQLSPSTSPAARYAAMMAWDAQDGYMVLFGGYDSSTATAYNDTWTFVGGQWTQLSPTLSPPQRWRGSMANDPVDGYVVLFGGTDASASVIYKDTWSFSAGAWTDLTSTVSGNPTNRLRQEMVWDAADQYVVLYGGCTSVACTGGQQDTLTYVNSTWTLLSLTTKPSARAYEGMAYDAAQGYVLVFGGVAYSTNTATHDTWEFLNGTWTDLSASYTTYPATRAFEMLAYDAGDGYSVLFGGQNPTGGTYYNDTWAYGPSVIGAFIATPTVLDLGQSTTFNATPLAASGTVNYTWSNLPPGCTGGNFPVLTCTPTSSGVFNVTVTVNDSSGVPTDKQLTLTVNADPAIDAYTVSLGTVTSGTRIWFNVTASAGMPPYSYSYSGLPGGCGSSNTASLSCTPSVSGMFTVQADVRDGVGFHVYSNASVAVNPKPTLASFVSVPALVDLGQSVALWANISGGTAPLAYAYTGLPAGCAPVNGPYLQCTPSSVGVSTVGVNATDAFGWVAGGYVTIGVNPDPSIDAFVASPAHFDIGHAVQFYLNTTGGTGTLSFSYAGLPPGCNLGQAAGGSCTPIDNGSFTVTASAVDSLGFQVTASVDLVIAADPEITSVTVTPSSVDVGQNLTIEVAVAGGTEPFTFTYTGLPTGCVTSTSANISCKPRSAGGYSIVATVSDVWKVSSQLGQSFTVNADPSVSSFAASVDTVTVGSAVTFTVGINGGSGVYSYVYGGLPTGCTSADRSSLSCVPTTVGTYNVTVNVTDSLGMSATSFTPLTVQGASSSTGFLGLSGSLGYVVLLAIVAVVIIAIAAVMMRRRRTPSGNSGVRPAKSWDEAPPEKEEEP